MFGRRKKKRGGLEISAPRDFQHRVHTWYDPAQGCYVGLPPQWQSLIENLRRPLPLVDPSTVTQVELVPRKVSTPGCRGHPVTKSACSLSAAAYCYLCHHYLSTYRWLNSCCYPSTYLSTCC